MAYWFNGIVTVLRLGLQFEPGMLSAARALYRLILSQFQYSRPTKESANWIRTEQESNGAYRARYTQSQNTAGVKTVIRVKERYLPPPFDWRRGRERAESKIKTDGPYSFTVKNGDIIEIQAEESKKVWVSNKFVSHSALEVVIKRLSTTQLTKDAAHRLRKSLKALGHNGAQNKALAEGDPSRTSTSIARQECCGSHAERFDD